MIKTYAPETKKNIPYISMKLEDSERSSVIRLMKVKEMLKEEETAGA